MKTATNREFTLLQLTPNEVERIFVEKMQTQLRRLVPFQPRQYQGADNFNGSWNQTSLDQWSWISQPGMTWPSQSCPFGKVGNLIKPVHNVKINSESVAFALGFALVINRIWIQKIKDISISEHLRNGVRRKRLELASYSNLSDYLVPGELCEYIEGYKQLLAADYPTYELNEEDWVWACEFTISPVEDNPVVIPS